MQDNDSGSLQYCSALHELISGQRGSKTRKRLYQDCGESATITGRGSSRREVDKYSAPSTTRVEESLGRQAHHSPNYAESFGQQLLEIDEISETRHAETWTIDGGVPTGLADYAFGPASLGCRSAFSGGGQFLSSTLFSRITSPRQRLVSAYNNDQKVHS